MMRRLLPFLAACSLAAQTVPAVPARTAPAQTGPAQAAPVRVAPAQTAPIQTAPIQTAPIQAAPIQADPIATAPASTAVRLKDVASIEGVRENQLIGYGLVVGLAGTGDRQQTVFSAQTLANMLERMGVTVTPTAMRVTNTAAVMVTATLPAFAQPGGRIDATASAVGDASNLQGGTLLMTTLRGIDGQIYAVAQGPVVTGGFVAGGGGNRRSLNHPTVGRIPSGASVERPAPSVAPSSCVNWQLHNADFTTAARVADAVNRRFAAGVAPLATAQNAALVKVRIPSEWAARPVQFIAEMETLKLDIDRASRIIVNERTGTIVMGNDVKISPVAIMHGALSVEIQTTFQVSQPQPFATGTTQVVPQTSVGVQEEKAKQIVLKQGATVDDLVKSLQAIGATARDIIAILQNLRAAGALDATLEVI